MFKLFGLETFCVGSRLVSGKESGLHAHETWSLLVPISAQQFKQLQSMSARL